MIVLDTNVVSEMPRETSDPAVIAWLGANDLELGLPVVTIAEIAFGRAHEPALLTVLHGEPHRSVSADRYVLQKGMLGNLEDDSQFGLEGGGDEIKHSDAAPLGSACHATAAQTCSTGKANT